MYKERIQYNFNRASTTYDNVGEIQKQSASYLVNLLVDKHPSLKPSHILDIGSGTGYVIDALHHSFPDCHYIANDLSVDMLNQAHKKLGHVNRLSIQPGDAESIVIPQVDVIISNLAFQWFINLKHTLSKYWQKTDCLVFSTIIADTFKVWHDTHQRLGITSGLKEYFTKEQLMEICQELAPSASFYDHKSFYQDFANAEQFLKYVKELGVSNPDPRYPISRLPEVVAELQDGFTLNYEVFYAILIKNPA